jgi:hypothetical protein
VAPLLRDFGLIVSINTLVVLACALILIPPLLVWADEHNLLRHGAHIGTESIVEEIAPVPATPIVPGTAPPAPA